MKDILERLFLGYHLDRIEARDTLRSIAEGKMNPAQTAAFLTVYRMRAITTDELIGFREGLLDLARKIDLSEYRPIDVCGTGGDGKDTFNISTAAAFVLAGAGEKVAKHGNKSVSSCCGSSDVLSYLGVEFTADEDLLRKQIEETGFCYLHAPLFHPAMKNVAPLRQELSVKTFFNILGPLVNPACPSLQLAGVFGMEVGRLYAELFRRVPDMEFVVLHSWDGYDEVSLTGLWSEIYRGGEERHDPEELGVEPVSPERLSGGNSVESGAKKLISVLDGSADVVCRYVVAANAGAALRVIHPEKSIHQAFAEAMEVLDSGRAYHSFQKFQELSKK